MLMMTAIATGVLPAIGEYHSLRSETGIPGESSPFAPDVSASENATSQQIYSEVQAAATKPTLDTSTAEKRASPDATRIIGVAPEPGYHCATSRAIANNRESIQSHAGIDIVETKSSDAIKPLSLTMPRFGAALAA